MIEVLLPQLGESVAEGTITKWLVHEGDLVKREQPLCEVATDKADTEIPSPTSGRVALIAAAEGATVPTRGLLCKIDESATTAAVATTTTATVPEKSIPIPPQQTTAPSENSPVRMSPSARKLAREAGLDPNALQTPGRASREDVVRAISSAESKTPQTSETTTTLTQLIQGGGGFVPPIPGVGFGAYKVPPFSPKPGDQVVPFSRRRRITADHMVYSKVVSPHVVTVAEVDLHATAKLRDEHKDRFKKEGVSLTFLSFIAAATIKALREHPTLNARVLDNSYVVLKDINLGVAVDTSGGLIVPSIKQADQLSLRGIASSIDELASRARAGKTTADDLANTSFTVSNPGLKGNLFGGAIISQPNVGILRMGEIKKRVVVVTQNGEDTMAIHPVMFVALSYDHRIIDGVQANSFLWRVSDILSRAEFEI